MRTLSFLLFISFLAAEPAFANEAVLQSLQQGMQELQNTVKSLQSTVENQNEVIKDQIIRIQALESRKEIPAASVSAAPAGAPKLAGLSQGLNPDIGLTGTVQAKLTEASEDGEGNDTIALKELELSLAQYVDPYSRLDGIITFNDNLERQNVDIEEAYYSHWGLPWGFRTQVGKFRSKIGKQNLLHLHALDTTDYPEVIKDFLGDEGLAASGVRLVNDIPNPWDIPVEITGELLRGNNGRSFSGISRRPIFNLHADTFFETSENTNVEFGWTTLWGDENPPQFSTVNDAGDVILATAPDGRDKYGVRVYGADATFNWLLPEGKSVKIQNEIYFQRRGELAHINQDPWGFYSLIDYRFSQKFSGGVRFDYVEPLDVVRDHRRTVAVSPYLTFWQSEFANFRLQYTHREPAGAGGISDDAVTVAANVLIGSHKHPVQ